MGGAKRYPSIAFRGGAGFRRAQPILRTEGETRWRRITALPHTSRIAPRDANARLGVIARSEATKQSILSSRGQMDCFASLAMTRETQPGGRSFQKPTTRSAVDGIRRAKFTRALSISAGDATRLGPSRSRIKARTVAHSRPTALPAIRIGSYRSPAISRSRVAIFT